MAAWKPKTRQPVLKLPLPSALVMALYPLSPAASSVEDFNHDGQGDLILRFGASEAGLAPNEATACLSGLRVDGVPFEACGLVHSGKN